MGGVVRWRPWSGGVGEEWDGEMGEDKQNVGERGKDGRKVK